MPVKYDFESLYRAYYDRVLSTLKVLGFTTEESRDLAQETFVRILRTAHDHQNIGWRYVETVARRVAINDIRWRQAAKRDAIEIPDDALVDLADSHAPQADSILLRKEVQEHLTIAINALPPAIGETLKLSLAGLTHSEIASVSDVSVSAIRSRLHEARRRLYDEVGPTFRQEITPTTRTPNEVLRIGDEMLDSPIVSEPSLIFEAHAPRIQIARLIVSAQEAIVDAITREPKSIFQIPSRAFEQLVADIFKSKGFETELTKATRDGGRDIIAVHEVLGIKSKYIIECKRYAADRKVTLELVQRLYGVKMDEAANKAILATTSSFTRDAMTFASHHLWDLELKAYDDVMAWIREYARSIAS